ncbi:hypothetical protein [Algoriphagus sediminis]|uniref:Uncharacterized protein n=1 Tax=Algoriphagus sediminis TaxID=3057113 RepID=A0ABT7YH54_9BACT|nr:hypothetical protein [Algoriphagus sediminis]MDN3205811.1 hypothetical protein [Algoriphagus sediminis]
MRKLIFIFSLLFAQASFAQISNIPLNGAPARLSGYDGVEGSPYLFDDWARADVSTTNGGLKENVAYKFNIYENEFEVINEAGNKIFLDKDYVEYMLLERPSIIIANSEGGLLTKLLFKKGFDEISGVEPDDFVNVIAEGDKYSMVRTFDTELVTPPKNSYAPTPGKMFVFEEKFYVLSSSNEPESVRGRTKSIIKALAEKDQSTAKKIVKENNLNLSREDHLVIFFQKLNEA